MSSKEGMKFGEEFGPEYGGVVEKWSSKLKGVDKITDEMKQEWGNDLEKALGDQVRKELRSEVNRWKKVGDLPSKETIERYSLLAARASLVSDSADLLVRLRDMAQEPEPKDSITAAITVSEALKRVGQTVAQVFDMAKDQFNRLMGRHFQRQGELTGRRRWRTTSLNSRHRRLNFQEKNENDSFVYEGNSVYGPRPPGGSPEHWSNCSCYLERERANGDWVRGV